MEMQTVGQEPVVIRLPRALLPWQQGVKADIHRFRVVCAGRRSGKTILGVDDLVCGAALVGGSVNWYVGPTYGAAKDTAWDIFKDNLVNFYKYGLVKRVNESDLLIELVNGSRIQLKGADKPDTLRGVKLNRLVLDEYATMKPETWDEVLAPATSDLKAPVIFIGTPQGYNHFHAVFTNEQDPKKSADWKSWLIKTAQAGTLPRDEIERARRDMDPRVFRQEYEASFEKFGGQVFTDFDRNVMVREFMFNDRMEYHLGMDFGWSSPTATLFINVSPAEDVFVFDELMARETPINNIAAAIKAKVKDKSAVSILPTTIFCDPAGDSKNEAVGTSSVEELRREFRYERVRYTRNYPGIIQDGINQIRKWMRNGKFYVAGTPANPRCKNLVNALEMYRYPEPKGDVQSELPLKDGISDHWIDAIRYFFLNRFPIRQSEWGAL